jgi:hypothetical protein
MAHRKTPRKTADEIREELERRGITEPDVADAVAWARKTEGKGGIWAALRKCPCDLSELIPERPFEAGRKVDI